MAGETTTTTLDDIRYGPYIHEKVFESFHPYNVSWDLFYSAGPAPAISMRFTVQDDEGVGAAFTEATDNTTYTAISTTGQTATAGTGGMLALLTDEAAAASVVDAMRLVAAELGKAVAELIESDHSALYDNFSNTTGTSGSDLTLAQWYEAGAQFPSRDVTGALVAVLHPQQVLDLQSGSGNTPGGILPGGTGQTSNLFLANPQLPQNIMNDLSSPNGFVGTLAGIQIFQTSLVSTMANGADRGGAIFVKDRALGRFEVWGPRVELERNASYPGTELVASARYGVVEIDDAAGETIQSDA
jgi:hypothetical protein